MIPEATREYWQARSGTWKASPPFTPGPEDVEWFTRRLEAVRGAPRCDALLLGVTPELARLPWPANTRLHAVDQSPGMLKNVWSPPASLDAEGLCGDWLAMPVADGSKDIAVSDGCYTALGSHEEAAKLNAELSRVLRAGGYFCMRSFIRPPAPESLDALFAETVPDANLFRWRLAAAVQGDSREGVVLDDVWRCWNERAGDSSRDPAMARWRGVRMRFYFPTVAELRQLAAPRFEVVASETPGYPGWGERLHRIALIRK